MLIHSGDKPFGCTQCNYSRISTGNLERHKLIHSGEKRFVCSQCNYSCTTTETLKTHTLTHSGEELFTCTQCNYSCTKSSFLKTHMLTHLVAHSVTIHSQLLSTSKRMFTHSCVSSAAILAGNQVTWSITCFHTLERNPLRVINVTTPVNSPFIWRGIWQSIIPINEYYKF